MSAADSLGPQWRYGVTKEPGTNPDGFHWPGGMNSTKDQLHHEEAAMEGFVKEDLRPNDYFSHGEDAFMVKVDPDSNKGLGITKSVRIQGKSGKEGRAQRGADYNRERYGI